MANCHDEVFRVIGGLEAKVDGLQEDMAEARLDLKCLRKSMERLNLRVTLIASSISAAIGLLAWLSKLLL